MFTALFIMLLSLNVVGWLLNVHVMVGTGPPVEVQDMLPLPPS